MLSESIHSLSLVEWKTRQRVTLRQIFNPHRLLLILCQPGYLPPTVVRWYLEQLSEKEVDLKTFQVSLDLILWGPWDLECSEVRAADPPCALLESHNISSLQQWVDAQRMVATSQTSSNGRIVFASVFRRGQNSHQ